jgi:hypothetical protein
MLFPKAILQAEFAANAPKHELVINLKTAKALGLDVPPTRCWRELMRSFEWTRYDGPARCKYCYDSAL